MTLILFLIAFPLLTALLVYVIGNKTTSGVIVRVSSVIVILLSIFYAVQNFNTDVSVSLHEYHWIHPVVLVLEILLGLYIMYTGIKNKSYLVSCFAVLQLGIIAWYEFVKPKSSEIIQNIYIDKLSIIMILIIGVIGSLICIYAVNYMEDYHHHHKEYADRRNMFFATLFVFLSAMFGLVVFNDMMLMLFCWEITSLCSFLLIGYTKTKEATRNSFLALTMNVGGGVCFTIGIVILGLKFNITDFNTLLAFGSSNPLVLTAVFLMAIGGLTKSAQQPFSKWLLGAMVAPTPTSALLHSSTMVKAGVYLIIRIAPLLAGNIVGIGVTLVGSITFLVMAIITVSQTDAKRILAYSTVSNLGLIVACAGIGTAEAIWAAIMLVIFHAIAKSLLFLTVGSTEHQLGSRNIEDMDGLFRVSLGLTMMFIIGIIGMFMAPFGMLISKWAAMRAFLDSENMIAVLFVAFGSTITLFFWTKWLGKFVANANRGITTTYKMKNDEKYSLYTLATLVIVVCLVHPLLSTYLIIPYIEGSLGINFVSPIESATNTAIILTMFVLFIIPLLLVPIYKKRGKLTSVYLAGENTGDNESYYGPMGTVRKVQLRNMYMVNMFGEAVWTRKTQTVTAFILILELYVLVGGVF